MAQANEPDSYADELARIDASIAELKIKDMAAAMERTQIAGKIQAAQFQRDILAHANSQRAKKATKPRRLRRRPPGEDVPPPGGGPGPIPPAGGRPSGGGAAGGGTRGPRPPRTQRPPAAEGRPTWSPPGTPRTGPPGVATDGVTVLVDDPPPSEGPVPGARHPHEPHAPEASTQSVQNILLVIGALLLGVAAVVTAGAAVSNPFGRAAILAAFTVLALSVAPVIGRRGLTSTAETIAAVGLVLLPMTLLALRGRDSGVPLPLFLGITFAITAVIAFVYAGSTRLASPRYATVIAVQPVPPLLAYPIIESPAGWAMTLTAVAVLDLLLLTTVIRRGPLVPRWPLGRPGPADRESMAEADGREAVDTDLAARDNGPDPADPAAYGPDAPPRPESHAEEPDLLIEPMTGKRRWRWRPSRIFPGPRPAGAPAAGTVPVAPPASPPSADWLRELTFALLCLAVAGALLYAGGALIGAQTVPDALRSGLILVLAAVTASAAARLLDNVTARNVAGGVLILAIIAACARIAAVASPHWTMGAAAAAVAVTGVLVRRFPEDVRRGPQYASAGALTLIGVFVALDALRAAMAPVQAARPIWDADTVEYARTVAAAAGSAGWLLAFSALLLTVAAALALPERLRREGAVLGVALTALAIPASLALSWSAAPWPLVLAAIGIGGAGLLAPTRRAAITHIAAAGVVGLFGAAASLSASWLTAAVLTALAGAGVMVAIAARQMPVQLYAWLVGDWAAGSAAFAVPGAAVIAVLATADRGGGPPPTAAVTVPALAWGFLAVAGTLTYAAVFQVARREISLPLTVGTGLGAVALALAAILAPGATAADVWVGVLLFGSALLLFFAKSIDNGRRSDRMLDGPDIAAAGATVAVCGALTRVIGLAFPSAPLVVAAIVVFLVGLGVRTLQPDWRRGPVRGLELAGIVVGALAGWLALAAGLRILAAPGNVWSWDVSGYSAVSSQMAWQGPIALVIIAIAASTALPHPISYHVSSVAAALATIGAPAAFGLPWWAPLLVGSAVALAFGVSAATSNDPRAGLDRAAVATVVSLHFVAVGLARPWSTGVALTLIVVIGIVVAGLAHSGVSPILPAAGRRDPRDWPDEDAADGRLNVTLDDTGMPRHRAQIGGAATLGVLLAAPGVLAAACAEQHRSAQMVLTAALAASGLSLAIVAVLARWIPQYLPWATVGVVGGATITAIASLPTHYPTALYAAAAALLGVIAEMLRGATPAPGITVSPARARAGGYRLPRWSEIRPARLRGRWSVDPATGAVAVAILPTVLALVSIAPALRASLIDPLQQLGHAWDGPVAALTNPSAGSVDGTSVLATLLLTVAAALAATGFGGRAAETVPVILPGLAITLLIGPIASHEAWPASTTAALIVFIITMLGLALTPPPVATRAPMLRGTRIAVFVIGALAGVAGVAGSLATRQNTLITLASGTAVGLVAAIVGRSQRARILGWLFATLMGQFFVLAVALNSGLTRIWAAFGVLGVGAMLLILESAMPRLGLPQYRREATTVEWSGYASALIALALAYDSPSHLAALLAAWGAVLGLSVSRPGRTPPQRRTLFWLAIALEFAGWCLFMTVSNVAVPEAYTLPFAALALLAGILEVRQRSELSSWAAYGPALLAAFVPSIAIVLVTKAGDLRELLLLLGAVGTLILGSTLRQQAPVVVGAIATVIVAVHFAVTLVGPWLVLVPIGVVLLFLGATNESRRRTQELARGALSRMR